MAEGDEAQNDDRFDDAGHDTAEVVPDGARQVVRGNRILLAEEVVEHIHRDESHHSSLVALEVVDHLANSSDDHDRRAYGGVGEVEDHTDAAGDNRNPSEADCCNDLLYRGLVSLGDHHTQEGGDHRDPASDEAQVRGDHGNVEDRDGHVLDLDLVFPL